MTIETKIADEMKAAYKAATAIVRMHYTPKGNIAWQARYIVDEKTRTFGFDRISKKVAAEKLAAFGLTIEQFVGIENAIDAERQARKEACQISGERFSRFAQADLNNAIDKLYGTPEFAANTKEEPEMTTTNNSAKYAISLDYEVREADNSINGKLAYKVFDNMQDAANYAIDFIANNPDADIRLTNEHFTHSQINVYGNGPTKHYDLTDADINAVRNVEADEADVTAEAQDVATNSEIENAQADDVKVTEQDNSNVTINEDGKIFDSAKVTIEQAVNIISRLNYRNDTFQYRFTTREDHADIKYRHFDAYRQNGDKDAFAISEIVINGKLEIVRFANLFRDIIVDLHIGNLNCKLGYKGAIELVDEPEAEVAEPVNPERFSATVYYYRPDENGGEPWHGDKYQQFATAAQAANFIIKFAAEHYDYTITTDSNIRDWDNRKQYWLTDADFNALAADTFVKTTRQADALKDKISRDAQPSDDDNTFDLLPDVDDLPDIEDEWQYWQDIYAQINREQGNFTAQIGVATVTFRDWQIVEICDGFTSYKKVNGNRQYRISGRLVSRKEFEEFVLIGTDDKPEPPTYEAAELTRAQKIAADIAAMLKGHHCHFVYAEKSGVTTCNGKPLYKGLKLTYSDDPECESCRPTEYREFFTDDTSYILDYVIVTIEGSTPLKFDFPKFLPPDFPTVEPDAHTPQVTEWQDPHQYGEPGNLEQPRDISIYCAGIDNTPPRHDTMRTGGDTNVYTRKRPQIIAQSQRPNRDAGHVSQPHVFRD